jgi:hypothetical protein
MASLHRLFDLLRKNPERPPPGRSVTNFLEQADALFGVGVAVPDTAMSLRKRKRATRIGQRVVVLERVQSAEFSLRIKQQDGCKKSDAEIAHNATSSLLSSP